MTDTDGPSVSSWLTRRESVAGEPGRSFLGYHRADGQVGTRNYWLVIPLVADESEPVTLLCEAFQTVLGYQRPNTYERQLRDLREQYRAGSYFNKYGPAPGRPAHKPLFANIDGIRFLPIRRQLSESGPVPDALLTTLADYCAHPNVGGITVLSGSGTDEPATNAWTAIARSADAVDRLRQFIDQRSPALEKPLLYIDQTSYETVTDWLSAATHDTFRAMALLNKQTRQSASLAHLSVGVYLGETSGLITHPAVASCLRLVADARASVRLATADPRPNLFPGSGIELLDLPGDPTEVVTALTALGCTLHLTPPGPTSPLGNVIAPVAALTVDTDLATPSVNWADFRCCPAGAESLLTYLTQLASGEHLTQADIRGQHSFSVYRG